MTVHPVIEPRCDDLGYSLRRYFVDRFYLQQVPRIPCGSRLLDLGGTNAQKRGQFNVRNFPLKVVAANCSAASKPDVVAAAEDLPFSDGAFQAVICSELLEHVYSPRRVLGEVHRVLTPGGTLLLTAPFLVGIHADPADFGRYTEQFWRTLLAEQGFEIESLERQGAFWSVLCDLLRTYVVSQPQGGWWRRALAFGLSRALRIGRRRALAFETGKCQTQGRFHTDFPTGYGIVARRR